MRAAPLLTVLLFAATLGACGTTYPAEDPSRVMSVASPGAVLRAGSSVALMPGSRTDGEATEARLVGGMIEAAMRRELIARGFRQAALGSEPDLWFAYLAAETADIDRREALQRFGMHDANQPWPDSLPTGTVLVMLVDARTRTPVWRASTEVEIRREVSIEERRARIEYHVGRLFESCPTPR